MGVLIIYINTLAINEKFFFYKINYKPTYLFIFFFLLQIILVKNFYYKINLSNYISMNLYESMNFISLLFLILYLLLTLVCVVKLVKFEYGPLIKRLYNYSNIIRNVYIKNFLPIKFSYNIVELFYIFYLYIYYFKCCVGKNWIIVITYISSKSWK